MLIRFLISWSFIGVLMKFMACFFVLFSLNALAGANYPQGPNAELTPGKLCDKPTTYRYPEHVAYCDRAVDRDTKVELIKTYDQQLGFHIESMDRNDFKIDHYIPLCAGGSNDVINLWPQHKSIYTITDPVEPAICNAMAAGKLSQADAVTLVMKAKNDLSLVPSVLNTLNNLYH